MSLYEKYINYIKDTQLHLQPEQWDFKSNKNYTCILEHVNPYQGLQYLELIKFKTYFQNNLELLKDLCNLNDKYGKTYKYNFDNFSICSPTNLRYIFQAFLILEDIKNNNLNNINIVEIGGGYGGLCFYIYKLSILFKININNYTIFDLLEASQLQEKYLNALNINNVNFYQLENFENIKKDSYLISNYAFSEIPISIQEEYTNKLINPYIKYGFMAWNAIPVYNFANNINIKKEREYPLTGNNNYYIRFIIS